MLVLGLHMEHESSAALIQDGVLIGAIAQERISRIKKDGYFDESTIDYLLSSHNLSHHDIDFVAMGAFWRGSGVRVFIRNRQNAFNIDPRNGELYDMGWETMYPWLYDTLSEPEQKYWIDVDVRIHGRSIPGAIVNHQVAHAAAVYYTSDFNKAAICTIDASATGAPFPEASSLYMYGDGDYLYKLHTPGCMIGTLYDRICKNIGLGDGLFKAGSMMGLAPYGTPKDVSKIEDQLTGSFYNRKWHKRSDSEFLEWAWKAISGYNVDQVFSQQYSDSQESMNLAATAQHLFEKSVGQVLDDLYEITESFNDGNLCVSGGSFLNCSFNGKYVDSTDKWKNVHLMPACGDDGISIGSAFYATHNILRIPRAKTERKDIMYCGPSYRPVDFEWANKEEILDDYSNLAKYIEKGNVVAWYNGRSEFGPRALGNRSFLANPMIAEMRDHINYNIKNREWFRPFAPIVLAENAKEYFEIEDESPFMLRAVKAREDSRELIPSVIHVDGTSRVQTVTDEDNPEICKLIRAFQKETGIPVLLNTSLNAGGYPLVETPQHAFDLFYKLEHVNILAMNGTLYLKDNIR